MKCTITSSCTVDFPTLFNLTVYDDQWALKWGADGLSVFPSLALFWTAREVKQETLTIHTKYKNHHVNDKISLSYHHKDSTFFHVLSSTGEKMTSIGRSDSFTLYYRAQSCYCTSTVHVASSATIQLTFFPAYFFWWCKNMITKNKECNLNPNPERPH